MKINKGSKIAWIVTTVISLFAIIAGTYYSIRTKEQATSSNAAADVSLYFAPLNIDANINTLLTPTLKINPTTNQVTAVEANLVFDKSKLIMESIAISSTFTILKSPVIDNNTGTASFIIGVKANSSSIPVPITQITDIASINVRTKTSYGNALISVATTSEIAAKGTDTNVAGAYGAMTINVVGSATATATAIPNEYADWDVFPDGVVNMVDIGIVVDNYDMMDPVDPRADVDKINGVNLIDLGMVIDHYQ